MVLLARALVAGCQRWHHTKAMEQQAAAKEKKLVASSRHSALMKATALQVEEREKKQAEASKYQAHMKAMVPRAAAKERKLEALFKPLVLTMVMELQEVERAKMQVEDHPRVMAPLEPPPQVS